MLNKIFANQLIVVKRQNDFNKAILSFYENREGRFYKVLHYDCCPALRTVPPVRHGLLLSGCRHSCRCHRRLCRRCRGQAPRKRRASPARCVCVSSGANRPDSL